MQNITWRSISLNLCYKRRIPIRHCYPSGFHLCHRGSWLPYSEVIPFSSKELTPFFPEEIKLVWLVLYHEAFLLHLIFSRKSSMCLAVVIYLNTPFGILDKMLRDGQSIFKAPRHSAHSGTHHLSLFGARLHFKSIFDISPRIYVLVGSRRPFIHL